MVKIDRGEISAQNQINAFMPNYVHSMDACLLISFIVSFGQSDGLNPTNISAIHDCVSTTSDRVPQLNYLFRKTFNSMYSHSSIILDLHNNMIQAVKDKGFIFTADGGKVLLKGKEVPFPSLPKLGLLHLDVSDALYLLN